jgi:hypothetical protein
MTDMLLGQKTILISVMFALVPLLAAVMLVVIARIRQGAAQRRSKRARMAKRRLAQAEAARAEQAAASQSVAAAPASTKQAAAATATESVTPAATKATPSAPVAKPAVGVGAAATPEQKPPEEQPVSSTEQNKPANSAMQDILSSVFGDEEAAAQSEALLKGLDEVNISELAVLCREVAVKVHPDGTPVAENKE